MPGVTVSSVQSLVIEREAVQLTWGQVSCSQRLGLRPRYEILFVDSSSLALRVNTSTNSSPPYWVHALQPYTQYAVRVRYANEYGAAPYSRNILVRTQPYGTTGVHSRKTLSYPFIDAYCYSYKASCAWLGLTSGHCDAHPERQSAQMSKITNEGLPGLAQDAL